MIEKMKEQDCDKNKGIPRKKGNSLFYKMIMSRKFLGIFFLDTWDSTPLRTRRKSGVPVLHPFHRKPDTPLTEYMFSFRLWHIPALYQG